MKAVANTLVEMVILGVLGLAVGFGANSARGTRGLDPARNYFRKVKAIERTPGKENDMRSVNSTARSKQSPENQNEPRLEHDYKSVTFEEVKAILEDPNTETGLNVFIDARDDEAYDEGHIPGAIQCDHYRIGQFIDDVIEVVGGAEKIVVYCNGGRCEDSGFVCGDLFEAGVPYEAIYLYEGGWREWIAHDMPVETGRP